MKTVSSPNRPAKDRSLSALNRGLPLLTLGSRVPASLTSRGIFWLNRGAQSAQSHASAALAPLGIDPRHFAVLTLLQEAGPLSQQRISQGLNVDPTMMVSIVDDLERLGLARREVQKEDRRAYAVKLTPSGVTLLEEAEKRIDVLEEELFSPLTDDEYVQLLNLLRKLHPNSCVCGCTDAVAPGAPIQQERGP